MPHMSAEAVGRHMPSVVTLDDLAAMMTADGHHRHEISPEGVLSVRPPPGYAHAIIATRLMGWLLAAGVPAERIAQGVGLRITGRARGEGGHIPDLVVWSAEQANGVWRPVADVQRISAASHDAARLGTQYDARRTSRLAASGTRNASSAEDEYPGDTGGGAEGTRTPDPSMRTTYSLTS
jgi:hypothetical protein